MKKIFLAVLAIALLCPKGQAQTNSGQLIASQYGQWTVQGYAPNSYQFAPTSCRVQGGSSFFFAFAQGTPIKIVDGNPAMNEIVTPSNVIDSNVTCAVSIAPLNNHQLPFSLASATGGLQEALNANIASPQKNTIILDATWYQSVGASNAAAVIGAAKGSTQLGLVDQTQVPYVWYQWNTGASQYQAVSLGGGCTGNQCVISLNTLQGDINLNAGSNITLTPVTNGLTISAQTGAGVPGGPWNSARYGSQTGTAVPSPSQSLFQIDSTTALSQMNALIASLTVPPSNAPWSEIGTITVPDGVAIPGISNAPNTSGSGNPGVGINDVRLGARSTTLSNWGVTADERQFVGTFTTGQNTVTPGAITPLQSDVGRTIVIVGNIGGMPTRFMPNVTAVNPSNGVYTLSTPSPLSGAFTGKIGYLNTAAFQTAMLGLGVGGLTGQIPAGSLMTGPVSCNQRQSLVGDSAGSSLIMGLPGEDIFVNPDSAGGGDCTGTVRWANFTLIPDNSIDATKPWNAVDASGATTNRAPLNRPIMNHSAVANNPLGPGWAPNAQNGVAAITSGNAVICVPTTYFSRLTQGNQIVFRDTPTVFKTTVSLLTGAGCASGFSGATLATAAPVTLAQTEWVSTTSIQSLAIAISAGAITYPYTITVANPTTPVPGFESNVSTHGRVKMAGYEFDYLGGNNLAPPYTLILRDGPATTTGLAIGTAVVPENPCYAAYETPWPVTPTINSGDSTPSGATYFPGACVGNAAIAMPQANANNFVGTGFSGAVLENINIFATNSSAVNNTAGFYAGGNNAPYASVFRNLSIVGPTYDIVQGPPSTHTHGWSLPGPTGYGNTYSGLNLRGATNIVMDDAQGLTIDTSSGNTVAVNPYDGSTIGSGTAFGFGYVLDDQTGNTISIVAGCQVNAVNSEPGNGTHAEVPFYLYSDASQCVFKADQFEGIPNVLGGSNQIFTGGQLSQPVLDYGSQNVDEDTTNTSVGVVSNVYGVGSYLEWGNYGRGGAYSALGSGPKIASAVGTRESYDGDDSMYAFTGNYLHPYMNAKSGYISTEEFASSGQMAVGKVLDATEPHGSYTACSVGGSSNCNVSAFNGPFGALLVGPWDRIQPIPQTLSMNLKLVTGSQSVFINIFAGSQPGATCATPGPVATYFPPGPNNTWQPFSTKIDLSSYSGCVLSFSFLGNGGTSSLLEIGSFQLTPVPGLVHGPVATYTAGAACPTWAVPGDDLGIDGSNQYFCGQTSLVVAQPFSSTGGGINQITGDLVAGPGTGSVSSTVKSVGGGPAFTSQVSGPTCNVTGAGQLIPCVNGAFPGAVSGASVTGGTVINGVYSVPSSASSVFNISIANSQNLVLGQNTTTTLSAGSAGGEFVSFTVSENATGGFTFAWPSNFVAFPAINTAANSATTVLGYWDGTFVWSSGSMPNVFTTLGDTLYAGASGAPTRLAGSTSTQPAFLSQTGNGTISAAPAWNTSTGAGAVVLANNPVMGDITVNSITTTGSGVPCMTLGTTGSLVTICSGAGAPATTCGTQPTGSGSLYMRNDGTASTSLYSCAATTWTPVTVP